MGRSFVLVAFSFVFVCCGGVAEDAATSKAFNSVWTPQYTSIVESWNMSTALFSDGSVFTARLGDNGTVKNPNGSGMASVSGPVSFALHFDGIDDRLVFPYRNNNNLSVVSASLWIRLGTGSGERAVLVSQDAPISRGYGLYINSSNQPEIRFGHGNTNDWGSCHRRPDFE